VVSCAHYTDTELCIVTTLRCLAALLLTPLFTAHCYTHSHIHQQLLPLYSMSLQKNAAFRGGGEIRPDERSFIWSQLANMSVDLSRCFIYPRMFSIHDMPPDAGTPATDGGADVSLQLLISLTYMNAFN
jgi:hypothetical protein